MSLKDDKQQNIQIELDFSSARTGEAREAGREETESSRAMSGTENPDSTNRLMEEVCERENLKEALRRVKANKGSAGVDGMTVGTCQEFCVNGSSFPCAAGDFGRKWPRRVRDRSASWKS